MTNHELILPAEDEQTKRLFDRLERLERELKAEGFPPIVIAHGLESYGLGIGVVHEGAVKWARHLTVSARRLMQEHLRLQQQNAVDESTVH